MGRRPLSVRDHVVSIKSVSKSNVQSLASPSVTELHRWKVWGRIQFFCLISQHTESPDFWHFIRQLETSRYRNQIHTYYGLWYGFLVQIILLNRDFEVDFFLMISKMKKRRFWVGPSIFEIRIKLWTGSNRLNSVRSRVWSGFKKSSASSDSQQILIRTKIQHPQWFVHQR